MPRCMRKAGFAGALFQHCDQLGIRRQLDASDAVEEREQMQDAALGSLAEGLGRVPGEHGPDHALQAPRAELMQVGMPGRHQRDVQLQGEDKAKQAAIAGSGDVDDVGLRRLAWPS